MIRSATVAGPYPKATRSTSNIALSSMKATYARKRLNEMYREYASEPNRITRLMLRSTIYLLGCFWRLTTLCLAKDTAPKLIDCHVHHNGSEAFLQELTQKLTAADGIAMLITAPKDLDQALQFERNTPTG